MSDLLVKRKLCVESLPNEIWMYILEMGISNYTLGHIDVCSYSICCKHLNKLANQDTLWSTLLDLKFPGSNQDDGGRTSSKKSLYIDVHHKYIHLRARMRHFSVKLDQMDQEMDAIAKQIEDFDPQHSPETLNARSVACRDEFSRMKQEHKSILNGLTDIGL
ncbi:hypothetical protein IFM89_011715 [Coptis chinensis]|uniref:F-box domain-containing protein n=1 Tax=Coptis chinensis TaxID=261450 RepID=A0A835IUV9_9MAGN|nr:hypothetical protein IFM89_011715 [Coptis chinensis]